MVARPSRAASKEISRAEIFRARKFPRAAARRSCYIPCGSTFSRERRSSHGSSQEVGLEEDHEERREEGREEEQVAPRHGEKSHSLTGRPGTTPGRPAFGPVRESLAACRSGGETPRRMSTEPSPRA